MDNGAGGIELAVYSKVTGAGVLESSKLLTALQAASSDIQTSLGKANRYPTKGHWSHSQTCSLSVHSTNIYGDED